MSPTCGLAAELAEEAAAPSALALGGGAGHAALARLDENPALADEADLERLARAAADERLEVHVGLGGDLEVARPRNSRLRVAEGRSLTRVQQDGRAVRDDRHPAGAGERQVEQAAGERATEAALDLLDVPVDAGVEREQVGTVDGDLVVLEVDQVDVLGLVGQEHLAGPGDLHELGALAGHGLLEHPAHAARAGVLEADVALVGDHRAELRLDRDLVELGLQQLGVLKRERFLGFGLLECAERTAHTASSVSISLDEMFPARRELPHTLSRDSRRVKGYFGHQGVFYLP